ncbi:hypothetical protein ACOSOMT5_P2461 [Acidiphilium sp. MT5]|jgi:hypothetical protein
MKHAGPAALNELRDLITAIQSRGLNERSPGAFYRRGKAWLHFHEDKAGLFADLRVNSDWERFRVSTPDERATFLALVDQTL